jgi:hypothetical protein
MEKGNYLNMISREITKQIMAISQKMKDDIGKVPLNKEPAKEEKIKNG